LKKLMMLAAMLALVAAVAVVPALAQNNRFDDNRFDNRFFDNFFGNGDAGISQEVDQQSQSGDFSANFSVENTGDYASQCTPAVQFGNTGNFNNAPTFLQYASESDDFQPGGLEFSVEPTTDVSCSSTIQQSSAASA
jgi:opacity protein-like surface antigen